MERKKYLELCQKVSIIDEDILGIKQNIPNNLMIEHKGVLCYPVGYELYFDKGEVKHRAILKEIKSNIVIYAELNKIKEYEQKLRC